MLLHVLFLIYCLSALPAYSFPNKPCQEINNKENKEQQEKASVNCVVVFREKDDGNIEICPYNEKDQNVTDVSQCFVTDLKDLVQFQQTVENLSNNTVLIFMNNPVKEHLIVSMLQESHNKIDRNTKDQGKSYSPTQCNNIESKLTIRALYKLGDRIHSDCKLLIAEVNTHGECLARGLADLLLQETPYLCLEVFLIKLNGIHLNEIDLRMKRYGNRKKAFYLFTNPFLSAEFLTHKNIELIKNDSIWITEEYEFEKQVSNLKLLVYKHLTTSIFYPISLMTEESEEKEEILQERVTNFERFHKYNSKYILQVSTLSNKTFIPVFNVENIYNDDVVLQRSENSPDVDFVDIPVEAGIYRMVTILEKPLMMHDFDKYDGETNTCEQRASVLCSIPNDHGTTIVMTKSCCYGLLVDLLIHFKQRLNFKFTLELVKDGKFGSYIAEKDTYDGMIGEVLQGNADVALHAVGITSQRSNHVDFAGPFIRSSVSFFLPKQLPEYDYFTFSFISHINNNAIYSAVGLYIVTIILLFICDNSTSYLKERFAATTKGEKERLRKKSITDIFSYYIFNDCFLYIGGLVFQRGIGGKAPKTFSGKFMAQGFANAMLVVVTLYTATLTAHAVSKKGGHVFLGLEDPKLLNPTNRFKFAVMRSSAIGEFFKNSKNPDRVGMYNFMEQYNVASIKEGVTKVHYGKLQAFIGETVFGEYEISNMNFCKIKSQKSSINEFGYGIVVQKGSTLKEIFSEVILELEESGKLKKLKEKWFVDNCHNINTHIQSKFSLYLFTMPFLMLVGVACLSTLIMSVEMLISKFQHEKKQKRGEIEKAEKESMLKLPSED